MTEGSQSLQWVSPVNAQPPSQAENAADRRLIRSQALRHHHRQQRKALLTVRSRQQETRRRPQTNAASASGPSSPSWSSPRRQSSSSRASPTTDATISDAPASERADDDYEIVRLQHSALTRDTNRDPFDSLPLPSTPHIYRLLYHYGHVLGPSLLPVDVAGSDVAGLYNPQESLFLATAINHPALFHGTLYVAALHRELVTNEAILTIRSTPTSPPVPASIYHRQEALRILNASPTSRMRTDDGTIGILLLLAASETMNGNIASFLEGMKLLKDAVNRRGGLKSLGMGGLLHQMIHWCDMCGSTLALTQPHFALVEEERITQYSPRLPAIAAAAALTSTMGKGFKVMADTRVFSPGMFETFESLTRLTLVLESFESRRPTADDMFEFSRQRSEIEHAFLCMTGSDGVTKPAGDHRYVKESARLAGLIFVNRVLRAMPSNSACIIKLVEHLQRTLERTSCDTGGSEHGRLFLWILFLGGSFTITPHDRRWYVTRLVVIVASLGLQSWAEVKAILSEYLWPGNILEASHSQLWAEVQVGLY